MGGARVQSWLELEFNPNEWVELEFNPNEWVELRGCHFHRLYTSTRVIGVKNFDC